MLKTILSSFTFTLILVSCTSLKPLSFSNNKPATANTTNDKKEIKFLDINSSDNDSVVVSGTKSNEHTSGSQSVNSRTTNDHISGTDAEKFSSLQLKYSQLLNTNADQVQNFPLYENIDDWYGTRYKLGGTTKDGIDCSAFVQTVFISAFGITLPRTARDQYKSTRRISRTELKEGDLLFFDTRGGVSHVGIYLQNNKFVHASVSGVMISDMFEPYYVKHFISAGRVANLNSNSSTSLRP
jgi:cell wall-associated NlpC family hydrolase